MLDCRSFIEIYIGYTATVRMPINHRKLWQHFCGQYFQFQFLTVLSQTCFALMFKQTRIKINVVYCLRIREYERSIWFPLKEIPDN